MVDTLELTKKLEGAGFERSQAEAVASVVAASGHNTQITQIETKLHEHDSRFDRLDGKITLLDHKLEAQVAKARFEVIAWTVGALGVLAALLRLLP